MESNSPEIQLKILEARSLPGQKPGAYAIDFRSIGEALTARAADHPAQEFLVYYPDDTRKRSQMTYGEFLDRASKLAAELFVTYRIDRGDRVATLLKNHTNTALVYFAVWLLGAVVVPINLEETDDRVRFILKDCGAKLLVGASEVSPRIRLLGLTVAAIFSGAGAEPSLEGILSKPARSWSRAEVDSSQDALIVYTSGTTGVPKGVLLSQYDLLADARAISEWHGLGERDRLMCVLPIHHVNGIVVTLVTPLYFGGTVVLNLKFSVSTFWKILSEERVAIVSVVPTLLHFLHERNDDIARYELSKFRHFICGAGPLTVDLAGRFEERFGLRIVHGYGLSETTCYSCFLPVDLSDEEHRDWMLNQGFPSIGVPLPCNEMAIHDEKGKTLGEGERGEIVIRGHNVMKGYYQNPTANAAAFANGWFRSGDEGFYVVDPKNRAFFFITGRLKELIARGGVKFSPLEIDEVLNQIPGVRRGVAVGFENDVYGEEVGAVIELESGGQMSSAQIIEACSRVLPFAKCPKVVKFGGQIPLTSTGKIQRVRLKPLFLEFKSSQFREI